MVINLKNHLYTKGADRALDDQFAAARKFGKVRLGADTLFWRSAFRYYAISLEQVERIHRRIKPVVGRLCAGGRNFDVEYLVLVLKDGKELTVHIADDGKKIALELMAALEADHPQIKYGKE